MTNYQLPITKLQCPNCGTNVMIGDRFCEECGTPLAVTIPNAGDRCEKCGAGVEAIDGEGYCSNCGFRRETQTSDRIEITIQSNLAGISDRGLKHHHNEDYLACAKVEGKNAYVLVVCDGVSSSQKPELAAKVAAEKASVALAAAIQKGAVKSEEAIKIAVGEALLSVCDIEYRNGGDTDPPSTTIVAAVVIDKMATIGWLGDSRAYWISPQGSKQLTKDDSWLNDIVCSGKMSETEARKYPQAHAITRWLGVDIGDHWHPSIVNFDIPGPGYLLLCTDGMWHYAPDPSQMAHLVKEKSDKDAVEISRSLVEFARSKGGHDNITVALLSL
jgi:serine/threonine protein phosphatase PrpC/DNA-directed RNA polymerase subunit RPC12/RpoP